MTSEASDRDDHLELSDEDSENDSDVSIDGDEDLMDDIGGLIQFSQLAL